MPKKAKVLLNIQYPPKTKFLEEKENMIVWRQMETHAQELHRNKNGNGVYLRKCGCSYMGTFIKNQINGFGVFNCCSGDIYIGEFNDGWMQGNGEAILKNRFTYRGQFFKNECEGKGEIFYLQGSKFEGNFLKGKRHGSGIIIYPNGQKLVADWKNGYLVSGKLYDENETLKREILEPVKKNKKIKKMRNTKIDLDDPVDDIMRSFYNGTSDKFGY